MTNKQKEAAANYIKKSHEKLKGELSNLLVKQGIPSQTTLNRIEFLKKEITRCEEEYEKLGPYWKSESKSIYGPTVRQESKYYE